MKKFDFVFFLSEFSLGAKCVCEREGGSNTQNVVLGHFR